MTMIQGVDKISNKNKIAIVSVGYNRKEGLLRLLQSLEVANYGDTEEIPLVISIDCSGNDEVYNLALDFKWSHGDKYVNIQDTRLGLKSHIYQCGDLTKYFKAIVLLEDDLWVSPFYYNYVKQAVEKYGQDNRICEISLYRNERLGARGFYFDALHDGTDCFLWQDVSTWGECWTEQMWVRFREWLEIHDDAYVNQVDMPATIKEWTRAWSKYFIAYEVDSKKYVLFPHESLTTNFNDAGGEHGGGSNEVQVNVLYGKRQYVFNEFDNMVRYDIYTNNENLYDWLPSQYHNQVCLDLYGSRLSYGGKRYVLSMKLLPYKVVEEWGLSMRPVELNLLNNIQGKGIRLYDTNIPQKCRTNRFSEYTDQVVSYFLRGFNPFYLAKYAYCKLGKMILLKFRLK